MPRIKLTIEYDGTEYFGWQFQNNQRTIQEEIEKALSIIFRENIRITGAGRTDSGVHARNQVAHADIPERDLSGLKRSLNGILDKDIVIKEIDECETDFHARYDATSRLYRYYVSQSPTAISRRYTWTVHSKLNLMLMQNGAEIIRGTEDFRSFCKVKSEVKHHRCEIHRSEWLFREGFLVYEIAANRFLHGMVRAITGALIELGRGKITLMDLRKIIKSGDRGMVPYTAPAHGLFLENIQY
ncbi:MAG: tRNA pseudouridine(38-40) synthase TruA [Calditrichaceae bacterium]